MYLNYVLLFLGATDLVLGLIMFFRKGESARKYLSQSYKIIYKELDTESLEKV
jgi:hypothetical protein